ncbi:MAG: uracil-DNA glycosylase family protein [Kiritimatiellia bacterium]
MHAERQILNDILNDLETYLEDLESQGLKEIPMQPRASKVDSSVGPLDSAGLESIAVAVGNCRLCGLHRTRTKTVPGQGCPHPELLFVGEAPGEDEDRQGMAFVGRAGQLLTKIIEAMGLRREDVFIANILKCRPPNNRRPTPEEMDLCLSYLRSQIALLRPKIIVALGATAVAGLLRPEPDFKISHMRGKWREFDGVPLMPTYHPSYLLRNNAAKAEVWIDMQNVLKKLGRVPPPRSGNAG